MLPRVTVSLALTRSWGHQPPLRAGFHTTVLDLASDCAHSSSSETGMPCFCDVQPWVLETSGGTHFSIQNPVDTDTLHFRVLMNSFPEESASWKSCHNAGLLSCPALSHINPRRHQLFPNGQQRHSSTANETNAHSRPRKPVSALIPRSLRLLS